MEFYVRLILVGVCCTAATAAPAETLGELENRATPELAAPMLTATARDVVLTSGPTVWREDEPPTSGSLWGDKITIEAGHGRTWRGTFWGWQREDWFPGRHVHSSQEDFNTARMVNRWLLPYLRSAGAEVYPDRCPDEQVNEVICDISTIMAPHTSSGNWYHSTDPAAYGGSYMYTLSTSGETSTAAAQVRATIPENGYYGVTLRYPEVLSAATDAQFTVIDAAGYRHPFRVDQSRNLGQWVWLDRFYFEAGTDVLVMEATNLSSADNRRVVLDCVRLGGGMGTEDFGGGPSGVPRWQETATNWTKYNGAPSWVWQANLGQTHDYSVRFNYATWTQSALFLRLHTNGSTYHTGFGSEVYQFAPDSQTLVRLGYIYPKIIQSIKRNYRSDWTDRGVKANAVNSWPFANLLVELGFHDWLTDTEAMMDADFRRVAMRGYYEGTVDFFTSRRGVYIPEPPKDLAVVNLGAGMVRAQWTTATIGGTPDSYRVYYSTHPHCYKEYAEAAAPATSVDIGPLDPDKVYYFQFRAANAGGLSLPSETLAAMASASADARKVLLVNGFDRFDWDIDETDNLRNYCKEHAVAVADAASSIGLSISIDSATNEAIGGGSLSLAGYSMVNWMLGQESTRDETFSASEQAAVINYRNEAGILFVTGTDVALDLGKEGTPEDAAFLNDQLGATYMDIRIPDPDLLTADQNSIFAGLHLEVDKSGDVYLLLGADLIRTRLWTTIAYRDGGSIIGVYSLDQQRPVFTFTIPFETVNGTDARRAVMEVILPYMPDKAAVGEWCLY